MKLIAVTGYGQPDDRRLAKRAGFADHLTKPIDFHRLHAAIDESLQGVDPLAARRPARSVIGHIAVDPREVPRRPNLVFAGRVGGDGEDARAGEAGGQ